MSVNLQAVGAAVGGIIPLLINRNRKDVAGVPTAVYIIMVAMMGVACQLSFVLRHPSKIVRDDGTRLFTVSSRGWPEELKFIGDSQGLVTSDDIRWIDRKSQW